MVGGDNQRKVMSKNYSIMVDLDDRGYQIEIETQLLDQAEKLFERKVHDHKCMIISDSEVMAMYGHRIRDALRHAGATPYEAAFEPGEASKTLATVEELYHECLKADLDRKSIIVALGGGVPGDIAGFVAATYMRGIEFIQVPTTLLAMVDSSVGGKTGVDMPEGKNLVGAFWQPSEVLIDPQLLATLPVREIRCGLAEIVKYGMIYDAEFFCLLEKNTKALTHLDLEFYSQIIAKCCTIKANVVAQDERESGLRAILNYGHTFGHAIETVGKYRNLNHGEAVSIGMAIAADLAVKIGIFSEKDAERQNRLLESIGLPIQAEKCDPQAVLEAMRKDKKARGGSIRFVLPEAIGQVAIWGNNDDELLLETIRNRVT